MPVRIVQNPGEPISEVYSVDEALIFLELWSQGRQGPVFQSAMDYCTGAKIEQNSTEDARRAIAGFCRIAGIAAKDMPDAVMVGLDGEIRPTGFGRPKPS